MRRVFEKKRKCEAHHDAASRPSGNCGPPAVLYLYLSPFFSFRGPQGACCPVATSRVQELPRISWRRLTVDGCCCGIRTLALAILSMLPAIAIIHSRSFSSTGICLPWRRLSCTSRRPLAPLPRSAPLTRSLAVSSLLLCLFPPANRWLSKSGVDVVVTRENSAASSFGRIFSGSLLRISNALNAFAVLVGRELKKIGI